jgi:Icc-related predicted phosphoesterase
MKIVAISDTHNRHRELKIPKCDVLVFAGDATFVGDENEMNDFFDWFKQQPAKYLVFVPGNHEVGYYHKFEWAMPLEQGEPLTPYEAPYINVLVDKSITIEGLKFYGSPWTYVSPKWGFQFPWYERDCSQNNIEYHQTQKRTWAMIPKDVDVLITHTPPQGILDRVQTGIGRMDAGDPYLRGEVMKRKNLKYHFFGHIHEGYGKKRHKGVRYYNVAVCDRTYYANNKITVVETK